MTIRERFNAKWTPEPMSGCWLWTGGLHSGGYGCFKIGKGMRGAHRVSWELNNGPIPDGLNVLHRCDTPLCVNPDHLWLGTDQDNALDRNRKQRHSDQRGEKNGHAKLTLNQVIAIRNDKRFNRKIAIDYGVSKSCIQHVKAKYHWEESVRDYPK